MLKVLKDEKIVYSKELNLDTLFHTIDTYQNKCTIPKNEVCNTIAQFINDIALYKDYNEVDDKKIRNHKMEIRDLNESINNVPEKQNFEKNILLNDVKDRQKKLEQSNVVVFVLYLVLCFLGALVLMEYFYK